MCVRAIAGGCSWGAHEGGHVEIATQLHDASTRERIIVCRSRNRASSCISILFVTILEVLTMGMDSRHRNRRNADGRCRRTRNGQLARPDVGLLVGEHGLCRGQRDRHMQWLVAPELRFSWGGPGPPAALQSHRVVLASASAAGTLPYTPQQPRRRQFSLLLCTLLYSLPVFGHATQPGRNSM